jgi:hypothetical protein
LASAVPLKTAGNFKIDVTTDPISRCCRSFKVLQTSFESLVVLQVVLSTWLNW